MLLNSVYFFAAAINIFAHPSGENWIDEYEVEEISGLTRVALFVTLLLLNFKTREIHQP